MLIKIFCIAYCVFLVSAKSVGEDEVHLVKGVRHAVKEGVEKALGVSKSLMITALESLEKTFKEDKYKSEKKMKKFNGKKIKKHLNVVLKGKKEDINDIVKAAKEASCAENKEDMASSINTTVVRFSEFLDEIRDAILNRASGKLIDSLESFVDTQGTFDFNKELENELETVEEESDQIVESFKADVEELVDQHKGKIQCEDEEDDEEEEEDDSEGTKSIDQFINEIQEKLEKAKNTAGA